MNLTQILNNLDTLFKQHKSNEVESFIFEHIEQAKKTNQIDIVLTLYNELIGYYRSISLHQKSLEISKTVLDLIQQMKLENTISHATSLLNIATAKRAAKMYHEAIDDYNKVIDIYTKNQDTPQYLFASLYNNISMAYSELNDATTAKTYLLKALEIIKKDENHKIELASTYTNLANLALKLSNIDEAFKYINEAIHIFESDTQINSHYSYALITKAQLCYIQKDYDLAIETYSKALKEIIINYGENETFISVCNDISIVLQEAGFKKEADIFSQKANKASLKLKTDQMKGIEISEQYYLTYGKNMIETLFPEYVSKIAVGLVGQGSECFGYDDLISRDHDFGPSFCMWLTDEDYEIIGEQLNEAYLNLPKDFLGLSSRNETLHGKNRVGVLRISDFYKEFIGNKNGNLSLLDYLYIPSSSLATITNGKVFYDPLGKFSEIRHNLLKGYPKDIKYKKIAARLSYMAQSGQYNYARCMLRHDIVAANQALSIFINNTIELIYLFNDTYCPYYKWAFKGLSHLKILNHLAILLEQLVSLPLNIQNWQNVLPNTINMNDPQVVIIENICKEIVEYLNLIHLTNHYETYLDSHTQNVLEHIQNQTIKNKHVMEG